MVSCAARAEIARTRRITPQGPFTAIFLLMVSCPITFVWSSHGEKGVIMEENEEEDCDDNFLATLDSVPLMMIL
jgi:hypothetical protein